MREYGYGKPPPEQVEIICIREWEEDEWQVCWLAERHSPFFYVYGMSNVPRASYWYVPMAGRLEELWMVSMEAVEQEERR